MIAKQLLEKELKQLKTNYENATVEAENYIQFLSNVNGHRSRLTARMLECEETLLMFCEHKNTTTEVDIAEYGGSSVTTTTLSCNDCDKIISVTTTVRNA